MSIHKAPIPKLIPAALCLAALVAIACVTINVYFPEAEVKDLSEKIEEAIARRAAEGAGAAAPEEPPAEGAEPEGEAPPSADGKGEEGRGNGQMSHLWPAFEVAVGTALHVLAPAPAYAQNEVAAPEISNPAIRQIIQSRAGRVRELNRYKAAGAVGETNQALVEVRDLGALPLQERAAVQKLVREENADRERMFKEIAAATSAELSQLQQIRETYAQTLRQNANPGDWIQMPNGSWKQK